MQINMTTNAILLSIVEPPWWNEVEMYVERESSVGYIRNCQACLGTDRSFKTTVLSVAPPLFFLSTFLLNFDSFKLKMKFALIFLSILVVISHGQFHLQWERRNWRTPYFRPQHVFRTEHPVYYDYIHELVPPSHQFSPINRVAHMVQSVFAAGILT